MFPKRFGRFIAALSGFGLLLSGCTAQGSNALPYSDGNAKGSIGLCDKAGQPVTHGNVKDSPFVWQAVSSAPAPPPYDGPGRTATLYAYQPRKGQQADLWPGYQMTASGNYADPAHPTAVAAADDGAQLKEFVHGFPPAWDGLVELRMYMGVPRQPLYRDSYPATDIRVEGDSWSVVRGGTVSCVSAGPTGQSSSPPAAPPAVPTGTVKPSTAGTPGPSTGTH
ncbi:MAG TPA: hypothetical protein VFE00_13425 [Arthrobacter sp.]|jgi:hypothetical protein|nr:hypothetical protein [Arthrobacter sp.]